MTNEEKARELAIKSTKYVDDNGKELYNVLVEAALQEMAKWKDEQYAKAFAPILIELDELKHQIKSLLP